MNKIGCCTWIFGDTTLKDVANRAKQAGLNGVELFGDVEKIDPKQARALFADFGLEILSVTPGDADISHPDDKIRTTGLDYFARLIDFTDELGAPLMGCHGLVGRIKPVSDQRHEDALLQQSLAQVCERAARHDLTVVYEILNRYESHQVCNVAQGLALLGQIGAPNLKLLPDAYHMNIEEADPAQALRDGADQIGLYHLADSNRQAIGEGHTDFAAQLRAIREINYRGPFIIETSAPGPNPFTPEKGAGFRDIIQAQLIRSREALLGYAQEEQTTGQVNLN